MFGDYLEDKNIDVRLFRVADLGAIPTTQTVGKLINIPFDQTHGRCFVVQVKGQKSRDQGDALVERVGRRIFSCPEFDQFLSILALHRPKISHFSNC